MTASFPSWKIVSTYYATLPMYFFLGCWKKIRRITLCLERVLPRHKSKSIWKIGSVYERKSNGYFKRGNIWNIPNGLTYINNYVWLKSVLQFPTCHFQICWVSMLVYLFTYLLFVDSYFIYLFIQVCGKSIWLLDWYINLGIALIRN